MGHKSSLNIKLNVKILAVGASTNDQRTGYVHEVVNVPTHQWQSHDVAVARVAC